MEFFIIAVIIVFCTAVVVAAVHQAENDPAPVGSKIKCPCCGLMDMDVILGHLPPDNPHRIRYEVIGSDPFAAFFANTVCDAFENNQGKQCKLAICTLCVLKVVVDFKGQCTLYPGWPQPNPTQGLD